ncbi:hypothetical protein PROPHIBWHA1_54 [Mycobacterium phage prophiBWHA-1]|nr:hypothetical protein PROPHIBWHA1_54 [Mycobacterium phage prophiBWHA-1]
MPGGRPRQVRPLDITVEVWFDSKRGTTHREGIETMAFKIGDTVSSKIDGVGQVAKIENGRYPYVYVDYPDGTVGYPVATAARKLTALTHTN